MEAICKIKIQRLFTLSEITLEDLRKAGLSNTKTIKGGFTAEDALKYLVSLLKDQNLSDKKLHKVIEAIYCLFYFAEDNKIKVICGDVHDKVGMQRTLHEYQFDCVLDFIAFEPSDVERDIELFDGKVRQYFFISSASCYERPPRHVIVTESTPLRNPYWDY